MTTINKPIRTYFEPRARAQAGIGLAKLPTEVKQLIARMCDEQDQAIRVAEADFCERSEGYDVPAELEPWQTMPEPSTLAVLYGLSREWRNIVTPYRFQVSSGVRLKTT
ncbi:hypothetical protein JCM10908_002232 [Rhodotorula pacifica]|uniref:uncharacterized protein n=1 Tax=Rhodotorula pacifica TaxID=1495444 RepID=UPI003172BE14